MRIVAALRKAVLIMAGVMSKEAEQALKFFADTVNWQSPHSLDEGRFYEFIILTHREDLIPDDGDIKRRLEALGATEGDAWDWARIFGHGCDILRLYDMA
jgi:hypothetical protein